MTSFCILHGGDRSNQKSKIWVCFETRTVHDIFHNISRLHLFHSFPVKFHHLDYLLISTHYFITFSSFSPWQLNMMTLFITIKSMQSCKFHTIMQYINTNFLSQISSRLSKAFYQKTSNYLSCMPRKSFNDKHYLQVTRFKQKKICKFPDKNSLTTHNFLLHSITYYIIHLMLLTIYFIKSTHYDSLNIPLTTSTAVRYNIQENLHVQNLSSRRKASTIYKYLPINSKLHIK